MHHAAETTVCCGAQKCPPRVLGSAEVQRVLGLQRRLAAGDWVGFLRRAAAAPYLQACLAHMYFPRAHARALYVLARASGAALGSGSPTWNPM